MVLAEFQKLEQIKALYNQITPSLLIMAIAVYTLSFIVLWPVYDKTTLLVWYISGVVISVLRKLSAMNFQKANITIDECQPWINRAVIWAFLSGISWGFLFVFFSSPDHFFRLMILLGVYGGLISLSGSNFGLYLPVYLAFALPSTLLFLIKIIFIGGDIFYIASALVVAYFIEMTSIALSAQTYFNKTTELRYFNNTLLEQVVYEKETAEHAILTKTQFLAAASHDLRQPLHAQGLFIDALNECKLPTETNEIVSKIQLSTDALNSLLNSLLDISRLDADSVNYTPQNMPLRPMIDGIVQEYKARADEKETQFIVTLPQNLSVHCDEGLLYRIIRNLIDNAVKFTKNGTISITSRTRYNEVTITIADTGIGIAETEQARIFTEFTQLDNPERDRQKGLGLGLAIVKRLSTLMNIDISLESKEGSGTIFNVKIPSSIRHSIETQKTAVKTNLCDQPTPVSFDQEVVVIIDDEAEILDAMQHVLENWNARVITATDANNAIKQLHTNKLQPNLILADFRLRDNDNGIDAIVDLRNEFTDQLKAILITGDTSPDRLQLAQSANLTILHKPVSPALLRQTVHQALEQNSISIRHNEFS